MIFQINHHNSDTTESFKDSVESIFDGAPIGHLLNPRKIISLVWLQSSFERNNISRFLYVVFVNEISYEITSQGNHF